MRPLSMNQITTINWDFEQSIRGYHRAGYQGAGIWYDKLQAYGVEKAVNLLQEVPIQITQALFIGPFNQQSEAEYQAKRREDAEKIRIAGRLGAETVLAVSGALNGLTQSQAMAQVTRGLKDLAGVAEEAGVKLGLEPIHHMYAAEWTFVTTLAQGLEVVDAVNSQTVGVFLDVYHLWQEPGILDRIKEAAGKIVGVHINDWRTVTRHLNDRVIMGDGCIPLRTLLDAVEAAGWNGWYDIEIFSEDLWQSDYNRVLALCKERFQALWA